MNKELEMLLKIREDYLQDQDVEKLKKSLNELPPEMQQVLQKMMNKK